MSWGNAPKQDLSDGVAGSCLAPPSSCGEVPLFSLLAGARALSSCGATRRRCSQPGGDPSQSGGEEGVQVYLLLLGSHKRGILSWPDPRSCATDLSGTAPDRTARQSSKPDASTTPGHGSRTLSAPGSQGAPVLSEPL